MLTHFGLKAPKIRSVVRRTNISGRISGHFPASLSATMASNIAPQAAATAIAPTAGDLKTEYSANARSKCKLCGSKIAKGAWRVQLAVQDYYCHPPVGGKGPRAWPARRNAALSPPHTRTSSQPTTLPPHHYPTPPHPTPPHHHLLTL